LPFISTGFGLKAGIFEEKDMGQNDIFEDPDEKTADENQDFLPPLEFNSIILLLYLPALIQLGIMDDPATRERRENLELAKRNIDLLDLLKAKTEGNLEEQEAKFMEDALSQLKMVYLRKTEFIKT